jgi:cellulose biosynthesis protein BcsQ
MKTIGFFNNKGGVGKTSLVYHVAWMLSELSLRVIAADLDPQANLTSMFLEEEQLEVIWEATQRPTIYGAVSPQFRGIGDILVPFVEEVRDNLGLLVGDLQLSRLEDALSDAWPRCANGEERSFRVMSAFARTIASAGTQFQADVALIDVGPNLGALNRTVLLGCDFVVVPLGADLFSLQGLRNMGPTLRSWRGTWKESRAKNPDPTIALPMGDMVPAGYVVMRHSVQAGRPARAFGRWMARIPSAYQHDILGEDSPAADRVEEDPQCLAVLKDYRSLMPLAQEARKPMFQLRPADGAFGGHQKAVQECGVDFRRLARRIMKACGVPLPERS